MAAYASTFAEHSTKGVKQTMETSNTEVKNYRISRNSLASGSIGMESANTNRQANRTLARSG